MQADDDLSRDLVHLRDRHAKAANRRAAMQACAVALGRCQAAGRLPPEWLYDAIMSYLWPVTDRDRKQSDDDRNAVERLEAIFSVVRDGETPSMEDFETAKKRLGSRDPITPAGLKKLWQRQGETYLAVMKLKARRSQ